jgi:hypothetical protein
VSLGPHEIQVGILKRLRGAPIARHTEAHGLRFNPDPPYNVLATDRIGFAGMQRIARFARYWDLFGNSGRFPRTRPLLLGARPFERFMAFSDWLFDRTDSTHRISVERQFELARDWLHEQGALGAATDATDASLLQDYAACGARGRPAFLARGLSGSAGRSASATRRQTRHLA